MEKDFLKDLGYLGVAARIKRLSESLFYSIKDFYKHANIDIEPSWHLVLLILKDNREVSMLELAKTLNLSKPAITKMIKKMEQLDYVNIAPHALDNRKKMVRLSEKAKEKLPELQEIWNAGSLAVATLLDGNSQFMSSLEKLENASNMQSFGDRAIKMHNNN